MSTHYKARIEVEKEKPSHREKPNWFGEAGRL